LEQKNNAFSLVEITIAVLIISILCAVGIQYYLSILNDGRRKRAKNDLALISKAAINYYSKYSKWPSSLNALVPEFIEKNILDPWGRNYSIIVRTDLTAPEDEKYGCYVGCISKRFDSSLDGKYTNSSEIHWQLVDSSEINLN